MSRITKTIAETVSKKMTENILIQRNKILAEIDNICLEELINSFPTEVLIVARKHSKYFQENRFRFYVNGEYLTTIYAQYPNGEKTFYIRNIITIVELEKRKLEAGRLMNHYDNLRTKIKESLYSLRTHKRVHEEWPEAAKHLPITETNTKIAVPVKDIMQELNALNL